MVGLIFYLSKVNNFQFNSKIFDQKNTFKGKIGLFEIEDKRIKHVLNFYKVENNNLKNLLIFFKGFLLYGQSYIYNF